MYGKCLSNCFMIYEQTCVLNKSVTFYKCRQCAGVFSVPPVNRCDLSLPFINPIQVVSHSKVLVCILFKNKKMFLKFTGVSNSTNLSFVETKSLLCSCVDSVRKVRVSCKQGW